MWSGHVVNKLGLRATFLANNAVLAAGALAMALAPSPMVLAIGRFVIGLGCGVTTTITPVYLNDIAPAGGQSCVMVGAHRAVHVRL